MNLVKKIAAIILVAALGWGVLITVGFLADYLDYIPRVVDIDQIESFYTAMFGFGIPILGLLAILSISYIFIEGQHRLWFLWAPVYGSFLYSMGVMIYFAAG